MDPIMEHGGQSTTQRNASTQKTTEPAQDPIQVLCHATHYELTNLGKALTCPICCSTYSPNHDAVILPCVHAYCRPCIVQALRFQPKCPTCKQPAQKRSLVPCPILNDMALAYKQVTRALGWTPSVYSSMVQMTQLPPSSPSVSTSECDNDNSHPHEPNPSKSHGLPLQDCQEQWQASKAWARAMEQDCTDKQPLNSVLREERRRVVQINEEAMAQAAAVAAVQIHPRIPELKNRVPTSEQPRMDDARKSVSFEEKYKTSLDTLGEEQWLSSGKRLQRGGTLMFHGKQQKKPKKRGASNPQDVTNPTPRKGQHQTFDEMSNSHSPKRAKPLGSDQRMLSRSNVLRNSGDGESDQSSLIVLGGHNECVEDCPDDDRFLEERTHEEGNNGKLNAEEAEERDKNGFSWNQGDAAPVNSSNIYQVGSIVRVASRTWPGINKPGGVARVVKVHQDAFAYDVAYILGGMEKRVAAVHMTLEDIGNHQTAILRLRRGKGEIPVSVLQALARDGFHTAQTLPPSSTTKLLDNKENKSDNLSRKATKLESRIRSIEKKSTKRMNHNQEIGNSRVKKARTADKHLAVPELSDEAKCELACDRYRKLIEAAFAEGTVHAIVSSLPDEARPTIDALVRNSKKQDVKIKIQEMFNPKTTTLVIVPSESEDQQGLARVRTLKAMRASLAGIPIVSLAWIAKCSCEGKVVMPDPTMFIHSLPTKTRDLENLHHGTALIAARYQQTEHNQISNDFVLLPLKNVVVHLCGVFSRPPKPDIQLLIRESGGTIQASIGAAIKMVQSPSFKAGEKIVVFLCDDCSENAMCGITVPQSREIATASNLAPGRVLVINAQWLFESVTCGKRFSQKLFPPSSLRCRELWSICCQGVGK